MVNYKQVRFDLDNWKVVSMLKIVEEYSSIEELVLDLVKFKYGEIQPLIKKLEHQIEVQKNGGK